MEQFIDQVIDSPIGLYWIAFATFLGSLSTLAQAAAALFSMIAKATKSPKDDIYADTFSNGAAKLSAFIAKFAIYTKKAK